MRGIQTGTTSLTSYKVVRHDDTHNTWEPWKEVRDVEVLHTYFKGKQFNKIIPKKFSNI
jgi:hypothetical protein